MIIVIRGVLHIAEVVSRCADIDGFVKTVLKFGFDAQKHESKQNYFFLAKFTKRQNITKKGRLPTVELKPCLYKKRCKRAQSIQAWTLIVCILYVEINHLYENVRTKTHQVGNMYTTERRRKNDDKVESNYYFVGEKTFVCTGKQNKRSEKFIVSFCWLTGTFA